MVDSIDQAARSAVMARIRSKNTQPELIVRKLVFSAGYRYRLHMRNLPGSPDLVFSGRKKVIFVHGCFWHQHSNCDYARLPKSREEFWNKKFNDNKMRDQRAIDALTQAGWRILVLWECELSDFERLKNKIKQFLDSDITSI